MLIFCKKYRQILLYINYINTAYYNTSANLLKLYFLMTPLKK